MLALLLSLLISSAQAEPYWVIGTGQAKLNQVDVNGHWVQEGYEHRIDEQANTLKFGVGMEINSWLDLELDYRDLGEFNSMIRFVSDKNYNGHGCKKPCEPIRAAWLHGETSGIAASLIASPDWPVAPTLRLGAMWHWSKFTAHYAYGNGIRSYTREGIKPLNDSGLGYLLGVGIRAGSLDLEATWYPDVASGGSAYHDIYSLTASVRF